MSYRGFPLIHRVSPLSFAALRAVARAFLPGVVSAKHSSASTVARPARAGIILRSQKAWLASAIDACSANDGRDDGVGVTLRTE
jgi:hypothetical protein